MRNALYALGIGLLMGSTLLVGYLCYRVVTQFEQARIKYEQDLIREQTERFN